MRLSIATLLLFTRATLSLTAALPAFVPLPNHVAEAEGRYKLSPDTTIVAPDDLANESAHLALRLRKTSGLPLPIAASGKGISLAVDTSLALEGYILKISTAGVTIRGGSSAGVFYGIQTYLQTLPPIVFGTQATPQADWSSPALEISDTPTCSWRGLHLDSARHFQPKAFIIKFLDAMAEQKLNRMHWHIVDSESWRLEIKKYPKLVEVSQSFPAYYPEEIPTNPTFRAKYRYGHLHGGGYYTQQDVKEIVAYADKLHITIVPEIEFPGHAMAALTAYPEIGTTGKPPTAVSNITTNLIGVHPQALSFIKDVLDETMSLFPGEWIHFGGDEAPKNEWQADAYTQKRIDELGLRVKDSKNKHASEDALQAWLFNEMATHIAKKGRKAVGWEEIMHGDNINHLPKGSVIMPWLSVANGVESANSGYGVVHTSVGPFYLDSYQSTDSREPSALYQGPITPENILQFNLFPNGLTPEGRKNILGAQCQLWSELMPRTDDIEYQAFPRACALAELTWTAPERRSDTGDFMLRLAQHGARLTALNLNHRRVSPPASFKWSPEFLTTTKPWTITLPAAWADKVKSGKTLKLNFQYQSGAHGLDINSTELLSDGKPVAEDRHAGFSGGNSHDENYSLKLPPNSHPGKLELRISAKGTGGNDSHGEIILSTQP